MKNTNRIIAINGDRIVDALPKLKDPNAELLDTWKRATKSSVKVSGLLFTAILSLAFYM